MKKEAIVTTHEGDGVYFAERPDADIPIKLFELAALQGRSNEFLMINYPVPNTKSSSKTTKGKNMKNEFRINKTPPTADEIQIARMQIEQRRKKAERFCLPLMCLLIVGIVITVPVAKATLSDSLTSHSWLDVSTFIFSMGGFGIGCWIAIATIEWKKYWTTQNRILSIIELPCAEIALSLSRKYPEIDAYRRVAIQDRQLVNGDLKAMIEFAKKQESIELNAKLVNQQKTAFDAVHKADLPNITDIPSVPQNLD